MPEKAGEWEGTLDATKWKKCLQSAQWMGRDETAGEEDCLALNVHTDQVRLQTKLMSLQDKHGPEKGAPDSVHPMPSSRIVYSMTLDALNPNKDRCSIFRASFSVQ